MFFFHIHIMYHGKYCCSESILLLKPSLVMRTVNVILENMLNQGKSL